jgi:hypothetical protein
MLFQLRLFEGKSVGQKPNKVINFTWYTCQGNPIGFTEHKIVYAGNFANFQLLERHFEGRESTRDYGYGRGFEPIYLGSI